MNNQKSGAVGEQPATAVRQPIPVRPVDDSGPAWAELVTPWQQDADGGTWRRRFVGMFDGARVSQEETWPGTLGLAEFSNFRVIERGPDCPPWCSEHYGDLGGLDVEGEPDQWHVHQIEAGEPGSAWVAATITAVTGDLEDVPSLAGSPVIEVERHELRAAEARELAEAILRAVELVEGGEAK